MNAPQVHDTINLIRIILMPPRVSYRDGMSTVFSPSASSFRFDSAGRFLLHFLLVVAGSTSLAGNARPADVDWLSLLVKARSATELDALIRSKGFQRAPRRTGETDSSQLFYTGQHLGRDVTLRLYDTSGASKQQNSIALTFRTTDLLGTTRAAQAYLQARYAPQVSLEALPASVKSNAAFVAFLYQNDPEAPVPMNLMSSGSALMAFAIPRPFPRSEHREVKLSIEREEATGQLVLSLSYHLLKFARPSQD